MFKTEAPLLQLSDLGRLIRKHTFIDETTHHSPTNRFDPELEKQNEIEREILSDARRKKEPIIERIRELQAELKQIDVDAQQDIDWTRRTK